MILENVSMVMNSIVNIGWYMRYAPPTVDVLLQHHKHDLRMKTVNVGADLTYNYDVFSMWLLTCNWCDTTIKWGKQDMASKTAR